MVNHPILREKKNFRRFHCLDTLHQLVNVAKKRVHLNCMVSLFSPISKKEITLNI